MKATPPRDREVHARAHACAYCGRAFRTREELIAHARELSEAGMLQDHIAIHWPPEGASEREDAWSPSADPRQGF